MTKDYRLAACTATGIITQVDPEAYKTYEEAVETGLSGWVPVGNHVFRTSDGPGTATHYAKVVGPMVGYLPESTYYYGLLKRYEGEGAELTPPEMAIFRGLHAKYI